jgi:succinoglycan biosynthesis protein ExoA
MVATETTLTVVRSAETRSAYEINGIEVLHDDEPGLVTVVVPARNEEGFIEACVRSICSQSYRNLQIVVVDGASEDSTAAIVRSMAAEDPRIELLTNEERVIPLSLNLAVRHARGRWLVRVDAHSTVPRTYVAQAVEHLVTGKWGGVGGRKDGVGKTPQGRAIAVAMGSKFGVGNSTYHHGTETQTVDHIPFGTYPLDVIRSVGGWDEKLRVNQDFEFDHRVRQAGHEIMFDPELRIDWHCRQSFRDLEKQYARYGEGKVKIFRLHPESMKPRQVAPAILLPTLGVALAVLPRKPLVSLFLAGPYALFLVAGAVREHAKLGSLREKLSLPVAFASMHLGFSRGLWRGIVRQLQRENDE